MGDGARHNLKLAILTASRTTWKPLGHSGKPRAVTLHISIWPFRIYLSYASLEYANIFRIASRLNVLLEMTFPCGS
jgi:hypothetical protein